MRACGMEDGGGANRRGGACQRRSEGSGCFLFLERCGRKVDAGKVACAGRRPRRRDGARAGEARRAQGAGKERRGLRPGAGNYSGAGSQSQGKSDFGQPELVSAKVLCGLSGAGFAEYGGMSSRYASGKF